MNKFVLILFFIVLLAASAVGVFYLFQTQDVPFLSPPSAEKIVKSASSNCKNTGFATQDVAVPYIETLLLKGGFDQNNPEKWVVSVVSIGNNCWGIWVGNLKGIGNFYYEDTDGNLIETKSKFNLE